MEREKMIDRIMKGLGGKSINEENYDIDHEEVRDLIIKLFTLSASMDVAAELFEEKLNERNGKWFCSHISKGAVILAELLKGLSIAIFGDDATHEIVDKSKQITELLHVAAIEKVVNEGGNASDLN